MDATASEDPSVVGDHCHIIAESADGTRGDPSFPPDKLNLYDNLILLCKVHHKQIDDQVGEYSVEVLRRTKASHEEWVRQKLETFDARRQTDDERYAAIVEEWENRAAVSEWKNWTSFVFGAGQPHIYKDRFEALLDLQTWLFGRIWPRRYPKLEEAFSLFRRVLNDFCNVFQKHASTRGDVLWTEKFYHIDEYDEEKYDRLYRQFENHVGLVEDLALELTRAGNLVCDKVREYLIPNYRLDEGVLTVMRGPDINLSWSITRPEYSAAEREGDPYKNLENFRSARLTRDQCVGDID